MKQTSVLTGNFCYCLYIWAAQLIRGVFYLDVSFTCLFKVIRALLCIFWILRQFLLGLLKGWETRLGVFVAEGVDGAEETGSGYIIMVDVETPVEAFLNNFWTCNIFLKCRSIRSRSKNSVVCAFFLLICTSE
jgi:hypothetical protein